MIDGGLLLQASGVCEPCLLFNYLLILFTIGHSQAGRAASCVAFRISAGVALLNVLGRPLCPHPARACDVLRVVEKLILEGQLPRLNEPTI